MFEFDLSEQLKVLVRKLAKRDKVRLLILNKKIKEIVNNNEQTIEKYKNLKYGLSDYKRVHIDSSFVLLFKVYKEKKMIYFWKLEHHDKVYIK